MKQQITSISVGQCGKVLALFCFALSGALGIPVGIGMLVFGGKGRYAGLPFLFLPFAYLAFGYVMGALYALIYNLIARKFGGLEFTVRTLPE